MKATMFCMAMFMFAAQANWAEVPFANGLSNACAKAQTENKTVLLYVALTGDFKRDIIEAPAFVKYAASNFVIVAPTLQGQSLREFKAKYEVIAFPALILFNNQGSEIGRNIGYLKGTGPRQIHRPASGVSEK